MLFGASKHLTLLELFLTFGSLVEEVKRSQQKNHQHPLKVHVLHLIDTNLKDGVHTPG